MTTKKPTARWDTHEYARMVSAQKVGHDLLVLFEDGSWVRLDARRLLRPGEHGVAWEKMTVSPYEIVVPTDGEPMEISWLAIRALTDKEFNAYLTARAGESARRVGERLRALRQAR